MSPKKNLSAAFRAAFLAVTQPVRPLGAVEMEPPRPLWAQVLHFRHFRGGWASEWAISGCFRARSGGVRPLRGARRAACLGCGTRHRGTGGRRSRTGSRRLGEARCGRRWSRASPHHWQGRHGTGVHGPSASWPSAAIGWSNTNGARACPRCGADRTRDWLPQAGDSVMGERRQCALPRPPHETPARPVSLETGAADGRVRRDQRGARIRQMIGPSCAIRVKRSRTSMPTADHPSCRTRCARGSYVRTDRPIG